MEAETFGQEWRAAKTDTQKRAVHAKYPNQRMHERFFFGYDDEKSRVTLHDANGRPRITMFVANDCTGKKCGSSGSSGSARGPLPSRRGIE